jgi:hypothetical protein
VAPSKIEQSSLAAQLYPVEENAESAAASVRCLSLEMFNGAREPDLSVEKA